jgi:hypothetical protein
VGEVIDRLCTGAYELLAGWGQRVGGET